MATYKGMTSDQVSKAISEVMEGDLLFCQRLAIEIVFDRYCQNYGLQATVFNFLAWLTSEETGRHVVKALSSKVASL